MDIKLMPEKYKKKAIGGGLKKSSKAGLSKGLGRPSPKGRIWLVLSFVLLSLVILGCFGLWGYKTSLSKEKTSLDQRFQELDSQRELELETSFIELKERIDSFKTILAGRAYPLNTFKILEELTLPQVRYTSFSVDISTAVIEVGIEATGYSSFAKQLVVFENDPRIQKVDFSNVGLDKSGWVSSGLSIQLASSFLYSD